MREGETRVSVEQTAVVNPQCLGRSAGRLNADEIRAADDAPALVLGLWAGGGGSNTVGEADAANRFRR
jgi:hypothetical protein